MANNYNFDVASLTKNGKTMDEILRKKSELESLGNTVSLSNVPSNVQREDTSVLPKMSLPGFAGNVVKSAIGTAAGVGSSLLNVVNPDPNKNTIANLTRMAAGIGELFIPGTQEEEKYPKAVWDFYKQRYGSPEKIIKTVYEDPAGVALDASLLLSGGGTLAAKLGETANIGRLVSTGAKAAEIGKAIDPLRITAKLGGKALSKAGNLETKAGKGLLLESTGVSAPGVLEKFDDLTKGSAIEGVKLQDWLKNKSLSTYKDVYNYTQRLQREYNALTRTDTPIPKGYVSGLLNKRADEIATSVPGSTGKDLAKLLRGEAKSIKDWEAKYGNMTDTMLTDLKRRLFSSVPASKMTDEFRTTLNKEVGFLDINALEGIAKGSKALGKELQIARNAEEAMRRATFKTGSSYIQALKSYGAPAFIGAGVGGSVGYGMGGAPGATIGGIAGGLTGAFAQGAMGDPRLQRLVAKSLLAEKVPGVVKEVLPRVKLGEAAKVTSRVAPISAEDKGGTTMPLNQTGTQQAGVLPAVEPVATTGAQAAPQQPAARFISKGGQWEWDDSVGDWVPRRTTAGLTGGATPSLAEGGDMGDSLEKQLDRQWVYSSPDKKTLDYRKALFEFKYPEKAKTGAGSEDKATKLGRAALDELDYLENELGIIGGAEGSAAISFGLQKKLGAALKQEPKVKAVGDLRRGTRTIVARALSEVGNLSAPEQEAALALLPDVGDSLSERSEKFKALRYLIQNIIARSSGESKIALPSPTVTTSEETTTTEE